MRHTASTNQIYEKIERVCRANIDGETLRYEVIRLLRHVLPFDVWCWPLVDPETLISFEGLAESPYRAKKKTYKKFEATWKASLQPWFLCPANGQSLPE